MLKIYSSRKVLYFFFSNDKRAFFQNVHIHTPDLWKYILKLSAFQKMLNISVLQSLSYKLTKKSGLHVLSFGTSKAAFCLTFLF